MDVEKIEITEDEYEDKLNEISDIVDVCGFSYEAGTVLRKVDIVAFRNGLNDEPLKYKCGICGNVYINEDKAEDCCSEHKEDE